MLLSDDSDGYKVQLVEASSRKLIVELATDVAYPPVKECRLVWSPDSKRVAFFEQTGVAATRRSTFEMRLGSKKYHCRNGPVAERRPRKTKTRPIRVSRQIAPKEWLKSGLWSWLKFKDGKP